MAGERAEADRLVDREVLGGERWRAAVLSILMAWALLLLAGGLAAGDAALREAMPGIWNRIVVLGAFAAMFVVEVRIFFRAGERRREETSPPLAGRCLVAAAECGVPTLVLWTLLASGRDPHVFLSAPPAALYYLLLVLAISRLEPWVTAAAGVSATLGLFAVVVRAFGFSEWAEFNRVVLLAVTAALATVVTRTLRRNVVGVIRARATFGQYVSRAVADKLLEQRGELPSETRHVCVMFLDIRNFTSFAEHRSPDEVVKFLNDVFSFMIDVVNEHHGLINKFLGDGFMAVFGAPESNGRDCENALGAARALIAELERRVADGRLPPTKIGIGLHAGPAVTGNVGSATRREYTVIGDVVNLASRIESMNKELGSTLLLSGEVVAALPSRPEPLTPRGPVKVKGREAPVELFQAA